MAAWSTGAEVHGEHDAAPPGIVFDELREALQEVIGSVDKLRDETLPGICRKLRSIESSARTGAASPAPGRAATEASPQKCRTSGDEKHTRDQADELQDVLMSLHERFEDRMQKMYQQHSAQWQERLQALLGEACREPPNIATSVSRPPRAAEQRSRSPLIGQWRDPQGTAISIHEEGWYFLEPLTPGERPKASPVEFLPGSRCRLLLRAGEDSLRGAPFDVEASSDDTLIATSADGARSTLTRLGRRRPRRSSTKSSQNPVARLLTPKTPARPSNNLVGRLATSVKADVATLDSPAARHLMEDRSGKMRIFLSARYEVVQVVMTLLDAAVLAWRTQRAAELLAREPHESVAHGIRDDVVLVVLNDLLCLWAALDLAGRALAEGRYFFRPTVCALHSFEVFVVAAFILEVIAVHAHYDEGSRSTLRVWVGFVSVTRMLRLFRLVHMSKVVRHSSAFRELRMMMYAIQGAMKSLAWSSVMLAVVLLISGMFLTTGYLRHIVYSQRPPHVAQQLALERDFGTLFASMFTLGMAVTGGRDWGEVYECLGPLLWPYKCFYVCFQIFATLALLNVITAVFVESTMQRSGKDRESAVVDEITSSRQLLLRINDLFEEFDEDGDGQLKKEELRAHMHQKQVAAYFASLGVDVTQVGKLFLLLDRDNSGFIDRQEFLYGCLRLRGDAKSIDLAVLQSDVDVLLADMEELAELLRVSSEKINSVFESKAARGEADKLRVSSEKIDSVFESKAARGEADELVSTGGFSTVSA